MKFDETSGICLKLSATGLVMAPLLANEARCSAARASARGPISTARSISTRANAAAWFNRGITRDDLGDHAIVKRDPDDARGNMYFDAQDYLLVLEDYDRAIKADASNPPCSIRAA